MSDLFEDEEGKDLNAEEEVEEVEKINHDSKHFSDARRRLENLLEEKRLRDELEDFTDY
jgi:hypothetical protein